MSFPTRKPAPRSLGIFERALRVTFERKAMSDRAARRAKLVAAAKAAPAAVAPATKE